VFIATYQALEALMSIAQENNIAAHHCICTGDIVGYVLSQKKLFGFLNVGSP